MKVFEPFQLDTVNHCLWRAGERMPLTPKAFDVLRYLVEHADRLVTQDELLEAIWPETTTSIRKASGSTSWRSAKSWAINATLRQFIENITETGLPFCRSADRLAGSSRLPEPRARSGETMWWDEMGH